MVGEGQCDELPGPRGCPEQQGDGVASGCLCTVDEAVSMAVPSSVTSLNCCDVPVDWGPPAWAQETQGDGHFLIFSTVVLRAAQGGWDRDHLQVCQDSLLFLTYFS